MIGGLVMASYSFFRGDTIGRMLNSWGGAGFFSYVLPFLLIFCVIFAILSKIKVFADNKAINGIISLVVGLLALQMDIVPDFFSAIFPKAAVGISIVLVLLILTGFFIDPKKGWLMYTFLGIGAVIVVIILVQTAQDLNWSSGYWWTDNWPMIAGAVFIIIAIAVAIGSSNPDREEYKALGFVKQD